MNDSLCVEVPSENSRGDVHRERSSHDPKEAFGLFCQDLLRLFAAKQTLYRDRA
jgi:hypothetical protein